MEQALVQLSVPGGICGVCGLCAQAKIIAVVAVTAEEKWGYCCFECSAGKAKTVLPPGGKCLACRRRLTAESVHAIEMVSGTILHTSRLIACSAECGKAITEKVRAVVERSGRKFG